MTGNTVAEISLAIRPSRYLRFVVNYIPSPKPVFFCVLDSRLRMKRKEVEKEEEEEKDGSSERRPLPALAPLFASNNLGCDN